MHICALLYGAHTDLAERCVRSILSQLLATPPDERRQVHLSIALNDVHPDTSISVHALINQYVLTVGNDHGSIRLFRSDKNIHKYPMMRAMFKHLRANEVAQDHVMWFDDDSYILEPIPSWLSTIKQHMGQPDAVLLGKKYVYVRFWTEEEKTRIAQQPWCRRPPATERKLFVTGGWWVADWKFLEGIDYPWVQLDHRCAGDVLLGEAVVQNGMKFYGFESNVAINAGRTGQHSSAEPRGDSIHNKPAFATTEWIRAESDVDILVRSYCFKTKGWVDEARIGRV